MNKDENEQAILSKKLSLLAIAAWLIAGLSGILIVASKEINIPPIYGYIGVLIGAGLGGWLYGKDTKT